MVCVYYRRFGHPTPRMSSALAFGWRSPFISLSEVPKSPETDTDGGLDCQCKFAKRVRSTQHGRAKIFRNLIGHGCDWGISRSEIKEECGRNPQGDIREVRYPKRSRGRPHSKEILKTPTVFPKQLWL
jgi:hypothetical protein